MKRFKKDKTPTKAFLRFMEDKYHQYLRCDIYDLSQIYTKWSEKKQKALDEIRDRASSIPNIISYNSQCFTVAYIIQDEIWDCELFCVETKDNIYMIDVRYL